MHNLWLITIAAGFDRFLAATANQAMTNYMAA
jgi:hypothetical protein